MSFRSKMSENTLVYNCVIRFDSLMESQIFFHLIVDEIKSRHWKYTYDDVDQDRLVVKFTFNGDPFQFGVTGKYPVDYECLRNYLVDCGFKQDGDCLCCCSYYCECDEGQYFV